MTGGGVAIVVVVVELVGLSCIVGVDFDKASRAIVICMESGVAAR